MNKSVSFSFNKRYLVTGILVYLFSALLALNFDAPNDFRKYLLYVFAFVSALLLVFFIMRIIFHNNREMKELVLFALIPILIFIIGFSASTYQIFKFDRQHDYISKHPNVCGIVKGIPTLSSTGESLLFTLDVHKAYNDKTSVSFDKPCLINIYVPFDELDTFPAHGDSVTCQMYSESKSEPSFDGSYDRDRNFRQNNIVYTGHTGRIDPYTALTHKRPVMFHFEETGIQIRTWVIENITSFSDNIAESSLLEGILVGETKNISDELYSDLKASGFIHIASVSGMHTSYLFMVITILLGMFHLNKRIICAIAIPILCLFASVAMFTPSVCRAVIMMVVLLVANILRRQNDSITALFIAALILTVANPYVLESYSALLSFGATLGILVFYPLFLQRLQILIVPAPHSAMPKKSLKYISLSLLHRLTEFSVGSISLSISATIGLGYFMMSFYGYIQWGSIIGNILIFPVTAMLFIGGYAACLLNIISSAAAGFVSQFITKPAAYAVKLLTNLFSADFFAIKTPCPPKAFFIVYIILCFILYYCLLPDKDKKKKV